MMRKIDACQKLWQLVNIVYKMSINPVIQPGSCGTAYMNAKTRQSLRFQYVIGKISGGDSAYGLCPGAYIYI